MRAEEGALLDNKLVVEYVERRSILGNLTDKSTQKYYQAIRTLLKTLHNRGGTMSTLNETDALALIKALNFYTTKRGEPFSEETKYDFWAIWKGFSKYAYKKHAENWSVSAYETIAEYTYKINKSRQKKKSTFTPQEIALIIETEPYLPWKIFLMALFRGGPRIGEFIGSAHRKTSGIRVRDVLLHEDGVVTIRIPQGKTGPRTIVYVGEEARALAQWLYLHPYASNPDAPFFLNEALRPIDYKAAGERFKKLVKKAGLIKEKPCLYSARASAMTNDTPYYSDEEIDKKYGLVVGSKAKQRYIRQSAIDLKAPELRAYQARQQ